MHAMPKFFLTCLIRSRKMFWMGVLALIPALFALLLIGLQNLIPSAEISRADLFTQMAMSLYLHFLLPLMSVFMGTAVIMDEIDASTLSYLLTRPVPRWQMLLSKTLVSEAVLGILLVASLLLTCLLMSVGDVAAMESNLKVFLRLACLILIGSVIYVPLFCLLGGLVKKPLLTALFFTFGWEKIVGSLPGSLKYVTVVHYLNSLAPAIEESSRSGLMRFLMSVETSSPFWRTVVTVFMMIAGFHLLCSMLLSYREYVFQDE